MTVGDVVSTQVQLLSTNSLDVRPATSAAEWVIHNIYLPFGSTIELYRNDGTYSFKISNLSSSLLSYSFHCTRNNYLTITNVGTGSVYISYDGVITKES
jgi:hypothetical protein